MCEGLPTSRWRMVLEPQTLRKQGLGQRWETAGKLTPQTLRVQHVLRSCKLELWIVPVFVLICTSKGLA